MNLPNLPTRPFQIAVFAIFIMLAIVGLFLFANYSGNGSAAKVGTVTIWGVLPDTSVNSELNTLKQTNKAFANVQYVQKDAATFDAVLADALASGTGPDLILIDQEQLFAEKNKLSVIPFSAVKSERTYLDTYVPIDELYLTDQGTYGIPLTVDPLVLYYNRSILSSAAVPTPPTTWEAVTGLAPTLSEHVGGQISRSAVAFGSYDNVENARAIISLLLFQAGVPISTLQSGSLRAAITQNTNDTTGVSPAQSAINFYTQFSNPAKTVYSWNGSLPSARQAFTAGDLAFYLGYASEERFIAAANPNLDFDMTSMPQPATAQSRITYGLAYAFAIPKASRNASGALTVAKAFTDKTIVLAAAKSLAMAPAQRGVLTAPADDKYAAVYYPEALMAKGWLSPLPATTDSIFAAMIGNITSGRNTVQDALDRANQALDAAF